MGRERVTLGRYGEDLALQLLLDLGYELVERRWRCRLGEIDLVLRDRGTLVLAEVRTRRSRADGSAEESLSGVKRTRLAQLAQFYISQAQHTAEWRIDVVAVYLGPGGEPLLIRHIPFAIEGESW